MAAVMENERSVKKIVTFDEGVFTDEVKNASAPDPVPSDNCLPGNQPIAQLFTV